jgi:hypothetical protein
MRAVAYLVPTFWTRGSGKKFRGHPLAQTLALYLMSAPASNMVGLYYQPLTTILHETGLTAEEFDAAMVRISEVGFAYYDREACMVWVPESANYQIGEKLHPKDKRRPAVVREIEMAGGHRYAEEFVAKYGVAYGLGESEAQGLPPPQEAPSEPLPSEQKPRSPSLSLLSASGSETEDPDRLPLRERSALWIKDPTSASLAAPNPESWPEVRALCEAVGVAFKRPPLFPRTPTDPRVRAVLERLAEGYELAQLDRAVRGAALDEHFAKNAQFQSLNTILRDSAQVDRFCALADAPPARASPRRNGPPQPNAHNVNPLAKATIVR